MTWETITAPTTCPRCHVEHPAGTQFARYTLGSHTFTRCAPCDADVWRPRPSSPFMLVPKGTPADQEARAVTAYRDGFGASASTLAKRVRSRLAGDR